jgi:CRP-like cAMP-binding protein
MQAIEILQRDEPVGGECPWLPPRSSPGSLKAVDDFRELRLSHLFEEMDPERIAALDPVSRTIPAKKMLYRNNDWLDSLAFIRRGWAAKYVRLRDGRMQILSFLLPGESISIASLFQPRHDFSVQAVTEVYLSEFPRERLKAAVLGDAALIERFARLMTEREYRAHIQTVNLGRRTAVERVANLVMHLHERLSTKGMVEDNAFDFPLRQSQIADATGLTTVHVNRVLATLRSEGRLELADRRLRIIDLNGLKATAHGH